MRGGTVKRIVKTGDEEDVFTGWRRAYCWTQRAGACRRVKRQANRRERQAAKKDLVRGPSE